MWQQGARAPDQWLDVGVIILICCRSAETAGMLKCWPTRTRRATEKRPAPRVSGDATQGRAFAGMLQSSIPSHRTESTPGKSGDVSVGLQNLR